MMYARQGSSEPHYEKLHQVFEFIHEDPLRLSLFLVLKISCSSPSKAFSRPWSASCAFPPTVKHGLIVFTSHIIRQLRKLTCFFGWRSCSCRNYHCSVFRFRANRHCSVSYLCQFLNLVQYN